MSNWHPSAELPDLRRVGVIALDTETKDDRLAVDMGSGWPFGAGYICGVSVAYHEGGDIRAHYFPLRHPDSNNFDPVQLYQWLRDLIASDVHIITQNGLYDWGWLRTEAGILMPPAERLEEIGAVATLVDENRFTYGLEALCAWRGLPGKDMTLLKQGATAIGLPEKANVRANIWRMPAHYVGPYAEADAASTLALFENLNPILDREGTRDAYRLEVELLPMVLEMRRRGVRIDVAAAERARDQLLRKRDAALAELSEKLGTNIGMAEIAGKRWLTETFDQQNIKYPRTKKGNPSFTAGRSGWMDKHPHWLPQLITSANKYNKAGADFLEGHILGHVVNGRIHPEIHPHRSDDGGARSLRFSYSDPPLQQMPARDKEIAPLIRGCFLPEEGEVWVKPDISQQEFRLIVHYAAKLKLPRAQEAADRYRADPDADFHAMVAEMTGLERSPAKDTNFAKAFGAGVRKFAVMIGKSEDEAKTIMQRYDRELPFVERLAKYYERLAAMQGYIKLYDGARRHWDQWMSSVVWGKGTLAPCSREEAERRVQDPSHPWHRRGPLRRIDVHKAMNALIQGSAARHTKLWMRAVWREGIVPLLQMHDCLDCSVSSPEQAELVAQLGREAVSLEVPIQVDLKYGRNWGDATHTWAELHNGESAPLVPTDPDVVTTLIAADVFAEPGYVSVELSEITHYEPFLSVESQPFTRDCRNFEVSGSGGLMGHIQAGMQILLSAPPLVHINNGGGPGPGPGYGYSTNGSGGNGFNGKSYKILCPFHDDRSPSLHIYADGHYHCYVCNAHGAVEELPEAPPAQAPDPSTPSTDTLKRGMQLWQAATSIHGTLAEQYLIETRKLDLAAVSDINEVLRFHPRCPFDGNIYPCLIALFRDVETNEAAGIHRIALTTNAEKINRMMLGSWPNSRAIKLRPIGDNLLIGEGIETCIAGEMKMGWHSGLWAMGSADPIGELPVIADVKKLGILVDRERSGVGIEESRRCATRWKYAGRNVVLLIPRLTDTDFNNIIVKEKNS